MTGRTFITAFVLAGCVACSTSGRSSHVRVDDDKSNRPSIDQAMRPDDGTPSSPEEAIVIPDVSSLSPTDVDETQDDRIPPTTLLTRTTTTSVPTASSKECPQPKSCRLYAVSPNQRGWRPEPDGVVRIRYYLDVTSPPQSSVTSGQIREAYFRAIRVWESANPRLDFEYQGETVQPPVSGDGLTVFAYGASALTRTDGDGYIAEADIVRYPQTLSDGWQPCEQRDGSCTDTAEDVMDLQEVLTHELGHALGLDDLADTADTHFLTMQHEVKQRQRFRVTLALGDVLGVRHLYPTDAPLPAVYDP